MGLVGESEVNASKVRGALVRVVVSTLGGGLFYFCWLAVYLLTAKGSGPIPHAVFLVLAPAATALGYTTALALLTRRPCARAGFWCTFLWPAVGCAVGAGAVYPFGPMLIVFGMFVVGTASVAVREAVMLSRNRRG